ncbi:acetylserotonin O-methyltransferase [Amycolatopsis orientalis]|uniref:acetylserotonin O-methyltransferase n=1 Tax=Amycolatopsis orientalis TaxID=31958 RepID=UPI001F26ACCE|nr:acetylserotonin O-methyltransferase [Amycolatopsis orientalis]
MTDVHGFLAESGFEAGPCVPSRVVRSRLAARHSVPEDELSVTIVHASPIAGTGGNLEIFILPCGAAERGAPGLIERERAREEEAHTGWLVAEGQLERTRLTCRNLLGMEPDGGGHNPHDDPGTGGRSVMYFKAPAGNKERIPRFELTARGRHPEVLAAHLGEPVSEADEHTALLSLLAGHWSARAVHVATELRIPDALGDDALEPEEVAHRIGCDARATARFLRFLKRVGLVRQQANGRYETTERGKLLRADNPFSDLTRLYGGEFYDAWNDLDAALRTGRTAFSHRYGLEHFDYFATSPGSSRTFDRAMQAVTHLVAKELSRSGSFAAGDTVVDVGGGNGTLLRTIVKDHPEVSGVVFDRAHVIGSVPADDAAGFSGRLGFAAGDFFEEVPAGARTYLLSRVLHDWDDEDCDRILRNCRRACEAGARLLVVERLLPGDSSSRSEGDLAEPWDLQMLAVTGGRERDRTEYEKLLHGSGFRVDQVIAMPVELNLLVATAI